jgi:hypothetical protein
MEATCFLWNASWLSMDYMALYPRRGKSSYWKLINLLVLRKSTPVLTGNSEGVQNYCPRPSWVHK